MSVRKICNLAIAVLFLHITSVEAQTITEIIDRLGDHAEHFLDAPDAIAVDGAGNVYVAGTGLYNEYVFKITPNGTITKIIDFYGDGYGNELRTPGQIQVTPNGYVYVQGGWGGSLAKTFEISPSGKIFDITTFLANDLYGWSAVKYVDTVGNVYASSSSGLSKVAPNAGLITTVISSDGLGFGYGLGTVLDVVVDALGNVYVLSLNGYVFKITLSGTISVIIEDSGDGKGNLLLSPQKIVLDAKGNVFVVGKNSNNVFKITPGGVITEIIDASGGGIRTLTDPRLIDVDHMGNVYVVGHGLQANMFKITPSGMITEITRRSEEGYFDDLYDYSFWWPRELKIDAVGNVYLRSNYNVFQITPSGTVTEIINSDGDGKGNVLYNIGEMILDAVGNVYVSGTDSDNVFKISFANELNHETAEFSDGVLTIPVVAVGSDYYRLELNLVSAETLEFLLTSAETVTNPTMKDITIFNNTLLIVPVIVVGALQYRIELSLVSADPVIFKLTDAEIL